MNTKPTSNHSVDRTLESYSWNSGGSNNTSISFIPEDYPTSNRTLPDIGNSERNYFLPKHLLTDKQKLASINESNSPNRPKTRRLSAEGLQPGGPLNLQRTTIEGGTRNLPENLPPTPKEKNPQSIKTPRRPVHTSSSQLQVGGGATTPKNFNTNTAKSPRGFAGDQPTLITNNQSLLAVSTTRASDSDFKSSPNTYSPPKPYQDPATRTSDAPLSSGGRPQLLSVKSWKSLNTQSFDANFGRQSDRAPPPPHPPGSSDGYHSSGAGLPHLRPSKSWKTLNYSEGHDGNSPNPPGSSDSYASTGMPAIFHSSKSWRVPNHTHGYAANYDPNSFDANFGRSSDRALPHPPGSSSGGDTSGIRRATTMNNAVPGQSNVQGYQPYEPNHGRASEHRLSSYPPGSSGGSGSGDPNAIKRAATMMFG